MIDTVIKNCIIVNFNGRQTAGIAIDNGKIIGISKDEYLPEARKIIDAKGNFLLPGLIDAHIHLGAFGKIHDLPGYEEEVEGFKCAVVGGVTTLGNHLGMGDTAFNGSLKPKLEKWIEFYNKNAIPNVFFHIGVTSEIQISEIPDYVKDYGVISFKWYAYSRGENETWSMSPVSYGDMYKGFKKISELGPDVLAMRHCENMDLVDSLKKLYKDELKRNDVEAWYLTRPGFVEATDVRIASYLARITGAHFYPVHISSKEGLEAVIRAKEEGVRITAETVMHYLVCSIEEYVDWGTLAVESPSLKEKESVEKLWEGINNNVIQCIGTDSGTMTKSHKSNTVWDALAGFSEDTPLLGPVMLSEGVNKGKITLEKMVELCSYNNAKVHKLIGKGIIEVGADADLTIVDINKKQKVTLDKLHYLKSDFSLFEGKELKGWPVITIIAGKVVYEDGKIIGKPGIGKYISRKI
jgi:dihydropyrimidinase